MAPVAASWDLSLGYGGLFNFGHLALFGIGLYAYALLTKLLGLNPWLAMLAGGVAAVPRRRYLACPILRLNGIYIVLVTFAFSQLVLQLIISQSDVTGGIRAWCASRTLPSRGHNFVRDGKLALLLHRPRAARPAALVPARASCARRSAAAWSRCATTRNTPSAAASRWRGQRLITLGASALFTGIAGAFLRRLFPHRLDRRVRLGR